MPLFLALLFLSSGNAQVQQKYEFKDSIILNYVPDYDDRVVIGEITLKNDGVLPAKVKLKRYVICQISDYFGDRTYILDYRGKTTENYNDIFNGYFGECVEISAGEVLNVDIVPQFSYYNLKTDIQRYDLNNRTLPFYLFEVEDETDSIYNYCNNANVDDALKIINVEIRINKDDLSDEIVY